MVVTVIFFFYLIRLFSVSLPVSYFSPGNDIMCVEHAYAYHEVDILKVGNEQKLFGVFAAKVIVFRAKDKSQGIIHAKHVLYPWAKSPVPHNKYIYA